MIVNIMYILVIVYLSSVILGCLAVMFCLLRGDTITLGRTDEICQFMKKELTETDKKMQEQS